jgi:AcrR family transcriptional regulator
MAGKKQFEEGKALDRALVAFWHSGYEATSYVDLEAATGLNKSSLYNAFGGKSNLYNKCLERFEKTHEQPLLQQLHQIGLRHVLTAYFESLFEHFADSSVPCGSLATMQALATGGTGAPLVTSQMNRLQALLHARFERALKEGELPPDTDTDALTGLFLVLSRGLAVLHHGQEDMRILRQALTAALAILDAPPRK